MVIDRLAALRSTVVSYARIYVADPTPASIEGLTLAVRALERLEKRAEELETRLDSEVKR